ncbi:PD-(D/E)XK nuclease family transposase [uncultured Mitsuokella sp.]|uniref:PD-(D/E)XK nuclease family transposase n=1 Tax=uncultured Mitsuokella sp. TaxID=453120 RepID=UPI00262FD6D1|nr:PD-(D/E)XK nuclease family transposase [uncultured Mitsuokella sp.]
MWSRAGTPDVGTIVVEPDGGSPLRIRNEQTEDKTQHEGTVFYDIRFTALAPRSDKPIELIINIEAQNDFHPGYPLLKRAIYYCSRMISSQYGTIFTKSHYEKIQKVYSIWICTEPTKEWAYSITRYRMMEEHLEGQPQASIPSSRTNFKH